MKKKFMLHYESLKEGDEGCYGFNTHAAMIDFIDEKCIGRIGQAVWQVSMVGEPRIKDVFISDSHISIQDFMNTKSCWQIPGQYLLQEFENFQEVFR